MSDRASSSKTPPSPYVTRSGRVVKSPSLLLDDQSSFTDKPAESKKRVTRVMKFEERKNQKRMEVELKESEGESDSDEEMPRCSLQYIYINFQFELKLCNNELLKWLSLLVLFRRVISIDN